MSETGTTKLPDPHQAMGQVHEVSAIFHSSDAMQQAIDQLTLHGFDRADLSVPDTEQSPSDATPEAGARPADTEHDAKQARTLGVSTAAAAAALAAAGLTAATGGAAALAVAAAVAAGGAIGGATYAITSAANRNEQTERDQKAAAGTLMLAARAPTESQRVHAEEILRSAGGTDIRTS